jgi:hypothetical protein
MQEIQVQYATSPRVCGDITIEQKYYESVKSVLYLSSEKMIGLTVIEKVDLEHLFVQHSKRQRKDITQRPLLTPTLCERSAEQHQRLLLESAQMRAGAASAWSPPSTRWPA